MGQQTYTNWRNSTLKARMETDKKYMILKMGHYLISTAGLGWYILYTLRGIRFAIENNFIPVVDWKNCKIPQYDSKMVGIENVWEYFFEQPFNVGVDQAYESNDFFVLDDVRTLDYNVALAPEKFVDFYDKDVAEWRKCFGSYVRLKKELKEYFDQCINQQLKGKKNIAGILARGTDYKRLKPMGHLKTIDVNEIYLWIDKVSGKDGIDGIFLATEDESILEDFKRKYPGKVFSAEAKRYKEIGYNTLNTIYKSEDGYERDLKYLYSLYTISKCSVSLYSACGGGILASLMKKDGGTFYKFLCNGYNRPKGIIVGSYREKEQGKLLLMGGKPVMFYALNTLKLLHVEEISIIVTKEIKEEYRKIIGYGEEFGVKINYIVSCTYDIVEHMVCEQDLKEITKVVLLYADYFVHGMGIIQELNEKINMFDGAYVWGVRDAVPGGGESILLDEKRKVPEKAFTYYKAGNYSLMGKYVFDHELGEILETISLRTESPTLADVLNEYIDRKKLFFAEYKRGTVYSKIADSETLEKTGRMIELMVQLQREQIGDFEYFRQ